MADAAANTVTGPVPGTAANDARTDAPAPDAGGAALAVVIPDHNLVSQAVRTITALMNETEELRRDLAACGVPGQTSAVLTEMGVHGRIEARDKLIDSSVSSAREAYGDDAVDRTRLLRDLDRLVELERDIAHERRLLRGQDIDVHAINLLVQLIRHNPGDGGARAARDFASYAIACGLPIGDAVSQAEKLTVTDASVLPKIPRAATPEGLARMRGVAGEVAFGLAAGVLLVMALV